MYMENALEYSDLYMFNTQLQTTTGIHVQLPLLFAEYTFEEKKDIDEYIELLCDVDGYFENMSAFEKLRADNGYFMEDTLADEVIESCNSFLETAGSENGALISTFNEKLASVDGLSSQDIADYKAKNVSAVNEHVIPGYQSLVNALTSLKGSNRYSGGLCNYPDGSRYFEYILSSTLGWSKSVDEYDKLVVTNVWTGDLNGAALTQAAFTMGFPVWGKYLLMVGLVLFAFTTILGWNYYGERCIEYLLGVKAILPYRIIFICLIACGAFLKLEAIWVLADIVNGLMAIPNLIALLGLTGVIVAETKRYTAHLAKQKEKDSIAEEVAEEA